MGRGFKSGTSAPTAANLGNCGRLQRGGSSPGDVMIHSDPPRVKDSETNSELGQLLRFIFRKNLDVEGHWKKHLMGGGERLSHEAPSYPLGDAITTPRRIDGMRGGRGGGFKCGALKCGTLK